MKCRLCGQAFLPSWSLSNVWTRQTLCPTCKIEFVKRGECADCGKPGHALCADCQQWRKQGQTLVTHPLFLYHPQAKAFMKQYKFLGDTALLEVFKTELKKVKVKQDWIVPIPLSPERLAERRFNQAEWIARMLRGRVHLALERTDGVALSHLSRRQRYERTNPFHVIQPVGGKNILLVDDVYTTGITLRQAASRLREAGAKEISAVTLFRSV
ncbi:ComF family protein [Exiguobacterium antarcticum]|uniref:ComF family protein n=2 Tax=Exiguobacterium antarcticum TaxID=132920 RepID=A0ABT6QY55_9BACL|nr:Competence protein F [Exiguobacterium antarcticum B7]MDI3233617.1 ComF family protein [Exiguobacterium antarcticum]